MENDSNFNWVSQSDVCRCCLSTNGIWDVTVSYITTTGVKEVFAEIVQECYNITFSRISDMNHSRVICTDCADHLRYAHSFRRQVVEANRIFSEACIKNVAGNVAITESDIRKSLAQFPSFEVILKNKNLNVDEDPTRIYFNEPCKSTNKDMESKIREAEENLHYDDENSKSLPDEPHFDPVIDDDYQRLKSCRPKVKMETDEGGILEVRNERLSPINDEIQCKAKVKEKDTDSDTPIAQLNRKPKRVYNKAPKPANGCTKVSERKRVIANCNTVLKYTTACPFRHHRSWFQCFFCTKDFMEINLLRSHMNSHIDVSTELRKLKHYPRMLQIDITSLKCKCCSQELTSVSEMCDHFLSVHKKMIYQECIADYKVNTSPFRCHMCDEQFHVFRSLTRHLNIHYAHCICDVCGKSFMNIKRLKVHKRIHDFGSYPCSECGEILKTKISRANHMERVHFRRTLKCQICQKPMKHYNDRIKHMSEIHNITHTFPCRVCGREYNIKHYLTTHMRQAHGFPDKECGQCDMVFNTKHALKKHMLQHSGVKPFSCSVCSKTYTRNYKLQEHMKMHDLVVV